MNGFMLLLTIMEVLGAALMVYGIFYWFFTKRILKSNDIGDTTSDFQDVSADSHGLRVIYWKKDMRKYETESNPRK